eukprot:TRINITY_DN6984_c0_g1_i2.p1 TRINITY_DN6984_c0_g1~~TRINITY_DN6984_c0_g1_i2.p1  ORF type:complete len:327 (+),score=33.61 TRINITY_DN6984_c0_g1_i2:92-1072(+)
MKIWALLLLVATNASSQDDVHFSKISTIHAPSGRSAGVAFANDDSFFVYGGVLGTCAVSPVTSDLWHYLADIKTWHFDGNASTAHHNRQAWPAALTHGASVMIDSHRGFMFGGVSTQGPTDHVWIFNTTSILWRRLEQGSTWPRARAGHAMAHTNSSVYMYGGADGAGDYLPDLWQWTGRAGWSCLMQNTGFEPRIYSSLLIPAEANTLTIVGGLLSSTGGPTEDVMELKEDGWLKATRLDKKLFAMTTLTIGSQSYLIGGALGNNTVVDNVYIIANTSSGTPIEPLLVPSRPRPRAFAIGCGPWIFGGLLIDGDMQLNDTFEACD